MVVRRDYKARLSLIFFIFLCFFLVVIVRLFVLQIYQKNLYKDLAAGQYLVEVSLDPPRASVSDRFGEEIAFNYLIPSAFILPPEFENPEVIISFLQHKFPEVHVRLKKFPKKRFLWLKRKLTPQEYKDLKQLQNKDIHFVFEGNRFYPYPELSHVIGFTDIDNNGIAGIELLYTKRLKGVSTKMRIQKDARSKNLYFEKEIVKRGKQGLPVTLTIDATMHYLAFTVLKEVVKEYNAKLGSVLIMNPDTDEILVMATYPSFNANFHLPEDLGITKNNIVHECYEMGSVIKIFSALAALDEGVVDFDELVDCGGKAAYINKFRVENWKSVDVVPFYEVVRLSSNVGIAKVAQRLGEKLYEHLRNLSFGRETTIQFPGERSGFVNSPLNWSRSSLTVMSFGYEIMATLLQLGVATSIIANGGFSVQPRLVKEPAPSSRVKRKRIYKEKSINQIKSILEKIGSRYGIAGYRTMGKTGTARLVEGGTYSKKKHVYTFAGIIEKDSYRRVIVTFIKEPKQSHWWASQITAPLFQKVAQKMVIHERITKMNHQHQSEKALGI